ncbi:hypothetical protein P152DRAFT_249139 [Eremomyces bilateralis CBS 781.70]|uniref:Protection of telomeres protein 1 n=1 Tax=Eremomyces bilateralis CBS 781.70 TaxID=1392243 RepID=A0A6G1GB64_9PEZI|nr:uncharacterized protein P152DRAFT_249139 [Eremomyces bilateralis CBS 781.70]KAF1815222.1 hypothetical protein P152DRAFT_249139 [Eremomyces bilateralis CBS 781.70]
MEPQLPPHFLDLSNALSRAGSTVSVAGVCIYSTKEPKQSKGGDWFVTITINDPWLQANAFADVRVFGNFGELPRVTAGDICLCRLVMVTRYGNKALFSANRQAHVYLFPCSSIPSRTNRLAFARQGSVLDYTRHPPLLSDPTQEEKKFVLGLHDWNTSINIRSIEGFEPNGQQTGSVGQPKREKFALIKDMVPGTFYDMVGEVTKIFSMMDGPSLELVDYSGTTLPGNANSNGVREGDEYGYTSHGRQPAWSGAGGQRTIKVKLFDHHGRWASENVRVGDHILLQNIRTREGTWGMEARLHGDQQYRSGLNVHKIKPGTSHYPHLEALTKRKEEYLGYRAESPPPERSNNQRPPQNQTNVQTNPQSNAQTNGVSKKAKNRRRRRQLAKEAANSRTDSDSGKAPTSNPPPIAMHNQLIRCGHPDAPILSVSDITDHSHRTGGSATDALPMLNFNCRVRVRVIDFDPPNLEDFSRSLDDEAYNDAAPETDFDSDGDSVLCSPKCWEWAFRFLVEDALPVHAGAKAAQMELIVAGQDAEHLLQLDATDLRNNSTALAQLREKLFHLWGDLEEVKQKARQETSGGGAVERDVAATSRPFECCVKEYGVDVSPDGSGEWVRCHRIFKTTIS